MDHHTLALLRELEERVNLIERRVGLGKYAPVSKTDQELHGERVEARQKQGQYKDRSFGAC